MGATLAAVRCRRSVAPWLVCCAAAPISRPACLVRRLEKGIPSGGHFPDPPLDSLEGHRWEEEVRPRSGGGSSAGRTSSRASPPALARAPVLYVANAGDRTGDPPDPDSGRLLGHPCPPTRPWQLAPGPGGHLLIMAPSSPTTLTHVGPGVRGAVFSEVREVLIAPGPRPQLAGDGRGLAALTYHSGALPSGPQERRGRAALVLLDVASGSVEGTYALRAARDDHLPGSGERPAGPVAYLGIWRPGARSWAGAGSRRGARPGPRPLQRQG